MRYILKIILTKQNPSDYIKNEYFFALPEDFYFFILIFKMANMMCILHICTLQVSKFCAEEIRDWPYF